MTYAEMKMPEQASNPIDSTVRMVKEYIEKRRERQAQRQTLAALNALDNMALKDLAISRSEIYSLAYCDAEDRIRSGLR